MLVPRLEYSRELKIAAMREIDSGKGMAEVARMYQLSPKRLETWRSEWRAKGELAFPGKGEQPQPILDADRISGLERKVGQQTMEIDFLKKVLLNCLHPGCSDIPSSFGVGCLGVSPVILAARALVNVQSTRRWDYA
jgi:transposase